MNADFERYKKLMESWKVTQGLGPAGDASDPISPSDDGGVKTVTPGPTSSGSQKFLAGTLLCLDEAELAIYQRTCSDQALDIALLLMSDGSLKVERLDFSKRSVEELGLVRANELKVIKQNGRWTRKIIGYCCRDPRDAERLPTPEGEDRPLVGWSPPNDVAPARPVAVTPRAVTPPPRAVTPRPEPPPQSEVNDTQPLIQRRFATPAPEPRRAKPAEEGLTRGREITLKLGGKAWSAVYWGRDLQGHVLAHKTAGFWELTRLNLDQYKNSLVVGEEIAPDVMTQIMNTLDTLSGR